MIKARVLVGSTLLTLIVGIFALDHVFKTDIGFLGVVVTCVLLGLAEFYSMVEKKGCAPFRLVGLLGGSAYVFVRWLGLRRGVASLPYDGLVVVLVVLAAFLAQGVRHKARDAVRNISATILGFVYLPVLGCHILDLRHFAVGRQLLGEQTVIWFVLVAKSVDMGAYFVGRRLGRTKMSPVISPKKSVEGLAGGVLSGLVVGVLLYHLPITRMAPLPLALTMAVSVCIGISGQLGDLAESMIKRDVEVKDSSGSMPGLGGVLDVVDCLLISAPVTYYLLLFGSKICSV